MSAFLPFAGQRIAVVGLGRAGLPAAQRLAAWGAEVSCWDDRAEARAVAERAGLCIAEPAGVRADALLLSPGIPLSHPAAAGAPMVSDVYLLFRAVTAAGSAARFAGITGTNGKSTTTALLAHLLRAAGVSVAEGGNLGPAALSLPLLAEGVYALEMSSFMLERLAGVRFHAAAMLNLTPDHLDRHGDMAAYAAAKARLFAWQAVGDVAVLGPGIDVRTRPGVALRRISGTTRTDGVWAESGVLADADGPIVDLRDCPALGGTHNAENAAAAVALAGALGVPRAHFATALQDFPGLPHRAELVATIGATRWINDSKATNADSAARALASHERIVWIAGGVPKAGGIAALSPWFSRIAHALLIGAAAPEFARVLAAHGVPHTVAGTLEAAVVAARCMDAAVVLLSPACASYDQFANFEARGDRFRALVQRRDAA